MNELCGAVCPEDSTKTCLESKSDLRHLYHKAWKDEQGGVELLWKNVSAPLPVEERRGKKKESDPTLAGISEKTAAERRKEAEEALKAAGELSDPDADGPGLTGSDDNDTQFNAAWAVMPKTGTNRRLVLNQFFRDDAGEGWTDDQLMDLTGLDYSSMGPRRRELKDGGWLDDFGKRRSSNSNLPVVVWELTPEGLGRWQKDDAPPAKDFG